MYQGQGNKPWNTSDFIELDSHQQKLFTVISADLIQIAERLKSPAKATKSNDHRFSRWFFFEIFSN